MITPLVTSDYHLFHVLSMIYACSRVHLYIIMVCKDGISIGLWPYALLAAIGMVC